MKSVVNTSGKRKNAIARASVVKGTGRITVNNINISVFEPTIARLRLQEPLIIAGKAADKFDITLNLQGGGIMSQTTAGRLAIARALVEVNPKLKEDFLSYDRQLLVADVRRREVRKPNCRGKARAKRQKSYR